PEQFCQIVKDASARDDVSGVIVQQPLPREFAHAVEFIDINKDVDCLNPLSVAMLYLGKEGFRPATPLAVINLLDYYNIDLYGKNVVIVGRGNAVGKPLALMCLQRNATVTVCHTKTQNLAEICKQADIVITACGAPGLITPDHVTSNSIVIDVGLSFVDGKTCGDVDMEVYQLCRAVTPVPRGIGPVTCVTLLQNLIKAHNNK
ncbi:MAG: bifunctional 5,10-methylenetetrahydrofolate dehydrogenase/5,10-methenyltetrahydrofolate cyclohydrolase, partial [Clostridia bacterium]|nr:bifunctional 5,10-methylenetetrahydrofolate dehydrogenase/5,10-methenyltetrahydrofolate cyclohydrolase [Clostridia bacterium]